MIAPERIDQIVRIVERAGLNEQTIGALRESFSDMHFTYCMDDDVGAIRPVAEASGFNLYLVDGHEHCMRLTTDNEAATGIVLAEVAGEDDSED
jgi:Family of unknown function (DUF6129)